MAGGIVALSSDGDCSLHAVCETEMIVAEPGGISRQEEIRTALNALNGAFNPTARVRANRVLQSLRAADVEAVLAVIRRERGQSRRVRRAVFQSVNQYLWLFGFTWLMAHFRVMFMDQSQTSLAIIPLGSTGVTGLIAYYSPLPSQSRAAGILAKLSETRIIGPMADLLRYCDRTTANLLRAALIRELPTLRSSDAALLNTEQRAALNKELLRAATRRPQLALAILAAWEQVGDASCVPAVQKLANSTRRDKIAPAVVARAQECLPLLMDSAQLHRTHHELLRAAGTTPDGEATLLRAGSSVAGAEADLLRPGEAQVLLNKAAAVTSQTLKS